MAAANNVSLAESSVYRSIYNGLRNTSCLAATGQLVSDDGGGLSDVNKWTFVQRLLAIEEAHERKRMERERTIQDRDSHAHKVDREVYAHRNERPDTASDSAALPDVSSRWLNHQVLEDSPDRLQSSEASKHLPILNNGQQSQLSNLHKQFRASISSQILQLSADHVPSSPQTVFEVEDINQLTSANDRSSLLSGMSWSTSAHDDDISVVNINRKRPLRLPPILLPRLYTVSPRPLRCREFLTPTKIRGPITDEEWEDLKDCRYLRHAAPEVAMEMASSDVHYYSDLT